MERDVEPLSRQAMSLFTDAAESFDDDVVALTALIALFTGVRNYTIGHIHADWFNHVNGALWMKVPTKTPCTKTADDTICGDCNQNKRGGRDFAPKSDAGGGRRLKIPESWHNKHTDTESQQDLSLRSMIEHHFKLEEESHGNMLLGGKGLSKRTVNKYVKAVAEEADIGFFRNNGYVQHRDLGRVPDLFPHDLRATYCVQLARNDANPWKMCKRTGHADIESLKPYIKIASQEIEGDFENSFI
ncbi:tyrosine-type recombinase/integrase [Halorussus marinus]|jgi:hypothetical protein|uniref:tyrosine-type recombinase/integrase n=1 Tax=Halorussus marinus TaxID=2505976 RepID=UPI0010932211|nr:tyrosine-type recombinase/integrase [Halorussus marinus]